MLSRPVPVTAVMVVVLLAASVSAAVVGTGGSTVSTTGEPGRGDNREAIGAGSRDDGSGMGAVGGPDEVAAPGGAPIVGDASSITPGAARLPMAAATPTSTTVAPRPSTTRPPDRPTSTTAPQEQQPPPAVCASGSAVAGGPASAFTTRDPGLYVIRPDGSGVRRILRSPTDRNFYWVAWSPDARAVAASDDRDMWVVGADGSAPREIAPDLFNVQFPAWAPDGRSIAFVGREGAPEGTPHLYVAAPDGSARRRVPGAPDGPSIVTWSPDGARIAFATYGGAVWSIRPDGRDLRKHVTGSTPYSISWRGGDELVIAGDADGTTGVHVVGVDTGRRQLLNRPGEVATSPDCRQVAVADNRLTVVDAASGSSRELADGQPDGTHFSFPSWAPDGRSMAVTSSRTYEGSGRYETDQDVLVVGLDGSLRRLVDQDPTWGWVASARGWSPDAALIAFTVAGY